VVAAQGAQGGRLDGGRRQAAQRLEGARLQPGALQGGGAAGGVGLEPQERLQRARVGQRLAVGGQRRGVVAGRGGQLGAQQGQLAVLGAPEGVVHAQLQRALQRRQPRGGLEALVDGELHGAQVGAVAVVGGRDGLEGRGIARL